MAGFSYRGQLDGSENPIFENLIIANSQTIVVGDVVSMSSGFVIPGTSSTRQYGVVVGLVNDKGIDLSNSSTNDYDGTYTESSQTYVATSDNQTDKKVKAVVCADSRAIWYNDSNGTLTTAMLKQHFKLTSASQMDQSTNSATVGHFILWKLDPDADGDASKGLWVLSTWQGHAFTPAT